MLLPLGELWALRRIMLTTPASLRVQAVLPGTCIYRSLSHTLHIDEPSKQTPKYTKTGALTTKHRIMASLILRSSSCSTSPDERILRLELVAQIKLC